MPTPEPKTTVTYYSGTDGALGAGWDVMRVVYRREDGEQNSFVIARDAGEKIIRKTDLILDRWEVVSDEEALRQCQHCFDERDRLAAEKAVNIEKAKNPCKCGQAPILLAHQTHSRDGHDESGRCVAGREGVRHLFR